MVYYSLVPSFIRQPRKVKRGLRMELASMGTSLPYAHSPTLGLLNSLDKNLNFMNEWHVKDTIEQMPFTFPASAWHFTLSST